MKNDMGLYFSFLHLLLTFPIPFPPSYSLLLTKLQQVSEIIYVWKRWEIVFFGGVGAFRSVILLGRYTFALVNLVNYTCCIVDGISSTD